MSLTTHAISSRLLYVFPDNISKTDAARIIKLHMQMFLETRFILGSKGQSHNVSAGLQTKCSITAAAYVSRPGFSLL